MPRIGQHLDLSLKRKREVIGTLTEEYPAQVVCEVLRPPRNWGLGVSTAPIDAARARSGWPRQRTTVRQLARRC